ncbi:GntR family transcriptional regulator [Micromonospora sp. NBC_01655]|uniref:winged helix-turn-helix domain-containing protein n=1 Tax=Micromonospora sp. NBC_01655 TaxID=2975983 RepID=UPI002258FC92|nr:GntR family transcriptional regulator [Micromonospora sp. NBC_01655]MCX4473277.1 GntR family transcriptional regulator [Micromonospora sp. NBC_01655]
MVYSGCQPRRSTVPPRYRYEQIADDLAARIASGEFPPASKLPSRRELIEQYGVTEPVIDRAMQVLRIKGMIETLPGVGVFVAE